MTVENELVQVRGLLGGEPVESQVATLLERLGLAMHFRFGGLPRLGLTRRG